MKQPTSGNQADSKRPTGLILCGGRGSRAGGIDKGLRQTDGQLAVSRAACLLQPLCQDILISANRNVGDYSMLELGTVVTDLRDDFRGPLAGLEAAITRTGNDLLLVLPCDMPRLLPTVPEQLSKALNADTALDVVYAKTADSRHFLCAAMRTRCGDTISACLDEGCNAVRLCYARLNVSELLFEGELAEGFENLNA
ncbi:MAG: molybdenum cofactor guanylyltransferase [Congregibacter sp.]